MACPTISRYVSNISKICQNFGFEKLFSPVARAFDLALGKT